MSPALRIGFDARPVLSSYSGIGQYVRQLFSAMATLDEQVKWTAYAPPEAISCLQGQVRMRSMTVKTTPSRLARLLPNSRDESLDVFHGTNFKAGNFGQKKTVVTIHDLWLDRFPVYSKKLFGQRVSSWKTRRGAVRAEKIIAVSQFTKQEIHEVFRIPLERIVVIYHGCTPAMYPSTDEESGWNVRKRLGLFGRPFILFIGGAEPRKNHRTLFEALSKFPQLIRDFSLVAVGDETVRGVSLCRTATELGISKAVICPGSLSTSDLRVVYSEAEACVFPSLYEGFGFPLLEAMACGTPVITGQNSALPEVAGDAALYVNVRDAEQVGAVLWQLLNDSSLQKEMRQKGFNRVQNFCWERAAGETLAVYRDVINQ